MSDRDKKLLVYLGALIIVAAAYFLVGRPYLDKIDQQSVEKTQLTSELNEKRRAFENKEMYEQGITDATNKINEIIDEFPEDNSDEKSIMFASHAEAEVPIWFSQMRFAEETRNMINGEETQSASDVEQEQLEENVAAAEGESSEGGRGEGEVPSDAGESGGSAGIGNLMYRDTELGLTFETQYDGFKNLLAYIRDYEDRIVIKDIDVSYDKLGGLVSGSMVLSQYAILSPERELPDVITDVDNIGTENIFTNANYGGSILDLIADMYSDFISMLLGNLPSEALDELGTDYFVKVNAVTDNTNGKTIGRADDTTEETYITSAVNDREDVNFRITGEGGNYSVFYKIGNAEYTDTIEKASDGKIYVRVVSSARMGDDDGSAIILHVQNESDIPAVVNIEGDDPERPRIEVRGNTGNVTVNGQ